MIQFPICKINLGLHVVGRRPDGYHDLETVFLPVESLHDELEVEEAAETTLELEGIELDGDPDDNLCVRAWRLMHKECGIPPVRMRLKKNIPFGAGLGGGSSDAAYTLKMLNTMFGLGFTDGQLESRAALLGSDCAFFIKGRPSYATGTGCDLQPIAEPVLPPRYTVRIEMPDGEHVSTKEAYAGLRSDRFGTARPDLREAVRRPVEEWRDVIVNDFEDSVFPSHPAIAALKAEMYRRGACYASMSGSGAAVYGIFESGRPTDGNDE